MQDTSRRFVAVDVHKTSLSLFLSVTRNVSPSVTRISGPGTWPLQVIAGTVKLGAISQSAPSPRARIPEPFR